MFDRKLFGQRLRELRKAAGVKQHQLAALLELTSTQVSDMERGNTTTSMARLYQLCEYFHVSADYLLGLTDDPKPRHRKKKDDSPASKGPTAEASSTDSL